MRDHLENKRRKENDKEEEIQIVTKEANKENFSIYSLYRKYKRGIYVSGWK